MTNDEITARAEKFIEDNCFPPDATPLRLRDPSGFLDSVIALLREVAGDGNDS